MATPNSCLFYMYLGLDFKCLNSTNIVISIEIVAYLRTESLVIHLLKEAAGHSGLY
jgi:hypothetical protein